MATLFQQKEEAFRSQEQAIATKIARCLSDDVLSYDLNTATRIREAVDGWLPLTHLLHPTLGTTDEIVAAHAIRDHSPHLEISIDGKSIRRRHTIPDYSLLDARTLYVDHLPAKTTSDALGKCFAPFGAVERCVFPEIRGDQASVWAFVVFETQEEMENAARHFGTLWRPLTTETDLKTFIETPPHPSTPLGEIRTIPKPRWNELTDTYASLHTSRKSHLHQLSQNHHPVQKAVFQTRVLAKFTGAHPQATTRVLRKLFEMIAPVSFVETRKGGGGGEGIVRFKTMHGARLAVVWFGREYVCQMHKGDTGTLLQGGKVKERKGKDAIAMATDGDGADVQSEWAEWGDEVAEEGGDDEAQADAVVGKPKYPNISLELMTGDEEAEYWDHIFSKQEEKEWHQKQQRRHPQPQHNSRSTAPQHHKPPLTATSIPTKRPAEVPPPTDDPPPRKHIKFSDSSEED
ncbi:uncharacterized protein EV422DRAFT_512982 [Fimicolochytrium jonesii]|uniref:uncharacterized protein n=1 Tax=Fimicolochytrium jonesii TaxID=1396493 RepID=UPI0022FF402E|nr:uncharacterized protein EV422DRAFT_512982 [Fimicolochytrium jonesii]KAI8827192.1 hypothetical protein EV422DRAFT_512982 [Fimicolochytrium jonesii]